MSLPVPSEQTHLTHPKYRTDIDGLRAIAVLSVVGFHAFPYRIPGGFIGVDVFFIISGFLISSIILSSLQKGTFSISQFYARRVRRIFPALILVLITCYIFGWFALLPDEYKQLGKHITAGAGFVSNLFFWQESGYFDNTAETKPLLHLLSLGIEEQFYIIWPPLLYLAWKRRFNFLILAAAIFAISFVVNVSFRHSDPVQAFYSPLTRFWELLMGSILAYLTLQKISLRDKARQIMHLPNPAQSEGLLRDTQSILGALLIGLAVLLITKDMAFPGWWALLPTVGTCLIISAGQHAWLNRTVLSHRLFVWIGLISFPLYLWHWPLLSFARIMEGKIPSFGIRLAAIALALVLAWLTYRLVEHPLRFGKHGKSKVITLTLIMLILAGLGYGTYEKDGLKQRVSSVQAAQANEFNYMRHWDGWSHCTGEPKNCRILDPTHPADIAVVGDSHAGHLATGLADYFQNSNHNVVIKLSAGCMPFFEMEFNGKVNFICEGNVINKALTDVMASTSIKTIVLSGYALLKIQGNRGSSPNGLDMVGYVDNPSVDEIRRNAELFQNAMNMTLARLVASSKRVVFLEDVPELYFDPRECITVRPLVLPGHKIRSICAVPRIDFQERSTEYHRIVAEARISFPTVKFIESYQYFCDVKWCHGMIGGELLYASSDHLTPSGSRYLVNKIANQLLE